MNSKTKRIKLENSNVDFIKPEWFHLPAHLQVDSPLQKLKRRMANRDNIVDQTKKSYTESRKEAADLRKHILNLVKCDELVKDDSITPNDTECNLIRYYYYIHQGVDISNIAPLDKYCLENILRRAPGRAMCRKEIINGLINEINVCLTIFHVTMLFPQDDFYFAIKKSVIDFTLQDYNCKNAPVLPEPKYSLDEINIRKEYFNKIKCKIRKNLFIIHPTIVKIGHLWYLQYRLGVILPSRVD
ncbi:dynein axonemal heavy chain 7-like [Planococcus citri]|uniref:dynein axonemal heavy chain 7-like n=1 Tax=Planococcus citri TaxID=170843 RepID=UPI0031F8A370